MAALGSPVRSWPISQYVLKVHSRCDLACDHCYVYENADQSWRAQPRSMAPATVEAATARIAAHAGAHGLPRVTVILHGGEPLLLGLAPMRQLLARLRAGIDPVTRLDLRMQTNGVLLSRDFAELFAEYDVRIGVSLDGDATANDRHRRYADGRSSHAKVLQALELLRRPEYRHLYAGLLCTVDIANDPVAVYEALRSEQPPRVDLLLPHATWDQPPSRPGADPTPYARWLLAVHDRWTADHRPMAIRLFNAVRSTARGGASGSEWVGLDPADLVVVETDGAFEQVDSLKITYDGAPATGLTVFSHSVDEVSALPAIARRQTGLAGLAGQCRACPVVAQCGGGLFAHRYSSGTGFDNPSVYCADLKELVVSLNARPAGQPPAPVAGAALPSDLLERIGSGRTDADAIRALADAQLSFSRALLVSVADGGGDTGEAFDLLGQLDAAAPQAVAATLRHPYIRVWAVDALRRFAVDTSTSRYLSCVAMAAAIRAGVPAGLQVPVRAGLVSLPGLGAVAVPGPAGGTVRLEYTAGRLLVRHGGATVEIDPTAQRPQDGWLPTRRLAADGYDALLEDIDPDRDCHDWKAAERLSDAAAARWAQTVREAWEVIATDAPGYQAAVGAGLRALVPLVADPGGTLRSSTARQAFGSVAVAHAPADAVAVMIVHEFQHTVLGALLDLRDLLVPTAQRLAVGWRADPRPVEGVLQGTFAHLAVADVWRSRAARPGAAPSVGWQYEQYRRWTAQAVTALLGCGALTPDGRRFVAALAESVDGWPR
jgi:uncharacterized protein